MDRLNMPDDVPIESKMVHAGDPQSAQTQVEQQNFEIRKNVLKYDEVLNKQRKVIYDERRRVLRGRGPARAGRALHRRHDRRLHRARRPPRATPRTGTSTAVDRRSSSSTRSSVTADELEERGRRRRADRASSASSELTRTRSERTTPPRGGARRREIMRELERRVVLSVLDRKWREHLYEMDYLQEGIGLRGDGAARPAGRVPARGLRHVHRDDGRHQGGVGRLPVQPRGRRFLRRPLGGRSTPAQPTSSAVRRRSGGDIGVRGEPVPSGAPAAFVDSPESQQARSARRTRRRAAQVADVLGQVLGQPKRPASLQYSAPSVDGEGGVTRSREVTRADGSSDHAVSATSRATRRVRADRAASPGAVTEHRRTAELSAELQSCALPTTAAGFES